MGVKNFFVDQLIILGFFLLFAAFSWIIFDSSTAVHLTILLCLASVLNTYRVLLIPFDWLIGKKTEYAYFSMLARVERIETSRKSYCMEWKFYYGKQKKLYLLNPIAYSFEDVYDCPFPEKDKKLKITYWKLSKILLSWEESP